MPLVIAILAGVLVFCLFVAILAAVKREELAVSERVGRLARKIEKKQEEARGSALPEGVRRRFKAGSKIASQLESAGILLRAEEFILAWGAATVVPSGLVLLFNGSPVTAFALAAGGAITPPLVVSFARKRRLALFEKQLTDALGIIGNSLRAGFTFSQAMESISREMPDPIAKEFNKTVREMALGVPMEDAMTAMVRRMENEDLGMLISAVLIQRQVGGNLADIIDNISITIRDRLKIKGEVKVMSASGRISGMVIGLLPVFLIAVLMILNPSYIMTFISTPVGLGLLAVAAFMEFIGFFIVQKIVNIKY